MDNIPKLNNLVDLYKLLLELDKLVNLCTAEINEIIPKMDNTVEANKFLPKLDNLDGLCAVEDTNLPF